MAAIFFLTHTETVPFFCDAQTPRPPPPPSPPASRELRLSDAIGAAAHKEGALKTQAVKETRAHVRTHAHTNSGAKQQLEE